MADGEGTLLKDNFPPTDPKEGSSKNTEQKKEQSLSTEAIIDGLFRCLKKSGDIPVNREAIETPSNSGQLIYHDRFPLKALTILAIVARHCTGCLPLSVPEHPCLTLSRQSCCRAHVGSPLPSIHLPTMLPSTHPPPFFKPP